MKLEDVSTYFQCGSFLLSGCSNPLLHHSQGSSMERWTRNTLRVVTASVLCPQGVFNTPFI